MSDPVETGALRVVEQEQWQVDEEGVGCGVNRQALDEVIMHYKELRAEVEQLRQDRYRLLFDLEHIAEYWNRDPNDGAMIDALWHIIDVAESALDKAEKGEE